MIGCNHMEIQSDVRVPNQTTRAHTSMVPHAFAAIVIVPIGSNQAARFAFAAMLAPASRAYRGSGQQPAHLVDEWCDHSLPPVFAFDERARSRRHLDRRSLVGSEPLDAVDEFLRRIRDQ